MSDYDWPAIPILAPYETPDAPVCETSVVDLTDKDAVEELLDFYKETLVPQLACAPDGSVSPHPQKGWLLSKQQPKTVIVARCGDELRGAVIVKNNSIYYPCAEPDFVASIYRCMWDELVKHFDYLEGVSKNSLIMTFASLVTRVPKTANCPTVVGERLEWRRA